MALKPESFFQSDATGSTELIELRPVSPASSTNTKIVNAFYGTDGQGSPQQVPISGDGKSLSIVVLKGIHPLVISLVSPNANDETVQLVQGSTVLATPTIRQHSAVSTIVVRGA